MKKYVLLSAIVLLGSCSKNINSSTISSSIISSNQSISSENDKSDSSISSNKESSSTSIISSSPSSSNPSTSSKPSDSSSSVHVHEFEKEYSYDETYHYHKAICHPDIVKDKEEHSFVDDVCIICKYNKNESLFTYQFDNNSYKLTGYNGNSDTISIPAFYDDKTNGKFPVTTISKNAFKNNTNIKKVILSDNITAIESSAFNNCKFLYSITLNKNLTNIQNNAFYNCYHLVEIINNSSLNLTIGSNDNGNISRYALDIYTDNNYQSKITIEDDFILRTYNDDIKAIAYLKNDTNLRLLDKITSINDYAFYSESTINSVSLNSNLKTIGSYAFYESNIISISFPDSLVEIKDFAFTYSKIESLIIPSHINKLGISSFSNCRQLTILTFTNGNLSIIPDSCFENCTSLSNIVISDTISEISNHAFSSCKNITSLTLGRKIRKISSTSFGNLSSLRNLIYNIETIDNLTIFSSSNLLETITIGEYVTYIPSDMFSNLSSLDTVYFKATNCKSASMIFRNSNLQSLIISDNVLNIPDNMCSNAINLKKITFADNVENIGLAAFDHCLKLSSFSLPLNLKYIQAFAFRDSIISSLTIPRNTIYVDKNAFKGNVNLETVTLDSSCYDDTIISEYDGSIFTDCTNIKKAIFTSNCNIIPTGIFADIVSLNQLIIENGPTSINYGAFWGCTSLTEVSIPKSIKLIDDVAFNLCTNLNKVTFEEGVEEIKGHAFNECKFLKTLVLPNSLKKITDSFTDCTYLNSLTIGNSLKEINGDENFYGCLYLATIKVSETNPYFTAIDNVLFSKDKSSIILYPPAKTDSSYQVLDSVKNINNNAFRDTINLTSISLPTNLETIGTYAFANGGLTSVVIPNKVKKLAGTFYECLFLKTITIGSLVENIDVEAFYACSDLTEFIVNNDNMHFKSIDGNLYNKEGDTIVKYAIGKEDKEFIVSTSIIKIMAFAFVGNLTIESFYFLDTNNWYISASSDLSSPKKVLSSSLDSSNKVTLANNMCDVDNYGDYYWFKKVI